MSLCKNCISGVTHEGQTTGEIKKINGVESYVAKPTTEYPKDKALLFLPDVFGIPLNNNKLLADDFAKNGFYTVIPGYLNGDAIPANAMEGGKFDLPAWFSKHGPEQTRPTLDKVIEGLKQEGITVYGATGYCFGGRYVVDLIKDKVIKAGVVNHPSLLKVPQDLEAIAQAQIPILFNTCEVDGQFPKESQAKADEILGGKSFYKRNYYEGCTHGFAVRGDISDPKVKHGKEDAFKEAVEWLAKHV